MLRGSYRLYRSGRGIVSGCIPRGFLLERGGLQKREDEEGNNSYRDGTVCDIENGEFDATNIDEINDISEADAVDHVTECAAKRHR